MNKMLKRVLFITVIVRLLQNHNHNKHTESCMTKEVSCVIFKRNISLHDYHELCQPKPIAHLSYTSLL